MGLLGCVRANRVSKAFGVSLDVFKASWAVKVSQAVRVSWARMFW